jgi:hypothetical protein
MRKQAADAGRFLGKGLIRDHEAIDSSGLFSGFDFHAARLNSEHAIRHCPQR